MTDAPATDPKSLLARARDLRAAGDEAGAARLDNEAVAAWGREPRHTMASTALRGGDSFRANLVLKQLVEEDGDDVLALVMFGTQASRANQLELAEPMLRRAVDLAPGYAGGRLALVDHLHHSKQFAEALSQLDMLGADAAQSVPALSLRADVLGELGQIEEQLALLERLVALTGNVMAFNLRIGHALRALGRNDEAERAYRAVIAEYPGEGTSWWSLANLKTVKFGKDDLATMRAALDRPSPEQNQIRIHFALGRALEERGAFAESFAHYDKGNRLRASLAPYDPAMITQWVERNEAAFTADFFAERAGFGDPSSAPIFVIGMQRSGSTLIEQILASHPEIEGTAELACLPNIVRQLGEEATKKGLRYEEDLATKAAADCAALGRDYLDAAAIHRFTDRPVFTDKMPNNWMHVSLIRLILPNAKIIDVRRDPMDCCFSNWRQLYARGLDHSNALETMGRYYADYVRLMRHFDRVQPGAIHRVVHDDLIADTEGEVRRLFDYLGIAYDPAVLDFHRTERAVRTISASQVRKPVNKDGVGRWKSYERWLGPLREALGETATQWRS